VGLLLLGPASLARTLRRVLLVSCGICASAARTIARCSLNTGSSADRSSASAKRESSTLARSTIRATRCRERIRSIALLRTIITAHEDGLFSCGLYVAALRQI